VVNFAPKEIYGIVKSRDESKRWEVSVPLMFNSPVGPGIGVTGTVGADFQTTKDHRMEIQGNLLQDDDHDEGANGLTWDLTENEAQRDGSLRHFTGIVVVQYQPGEAFWMKVSVKPAVKFSIDPRRLMQKEDVLQRLFQRNDDPILLDGETPLKGQVDLHCDDFSSEKFPWENVLQLPKEYEVCILIPVYRLVRPLQANSYIQNQLVMDPA